MTNGKSSKSEQGADMGNVAIVGIVAIVVIISPDEVQERLLRVLEALSGISKDEWAQISAQTDVEAKQQENLFKYYERSLKKLAAGVNLVDERVDRVLEVGRDITDDMGTRAK